MSSVFIVHTDFYARKALRFARKCEAMGLMMTPTKTETVKRRAQPQHAEQCILCE